jgi:hypothetical protein
MTSADFPLPVRTYLRVVSGRDDAELALKRWLLYAGAREIQWGKPGEPRIVRPTPEQSLENLIATANLWWQQYGAKLYGGDETAMGPIPPAITRGPHPRKHALYGL